MNVNVVGIQIQLNKIFSKKVINQNQEAKRSKNCVGVDRVNDQIYRSCR